jgi:hypothetical protein
MQIGDVKIIYADITQLGILTGSKLMISLNDGIKEFVFVV